MTVVMDDEQRLCLSILSPTQHFRFCIDGATWPQIAEWLRDQLEPFLDRPGGAHVEIERFVRAPEFAKP